MTSEKTAVATEMHPLRSQTLAATLRRSRLAARRSIEASARRNKRRGCRPQLKRTSGPLDSPSAGRRNGASCVPGGIDSSARKLLGGQGMGEAKRQAKRESSLQRAQERGRFGRRRSALNEIAASQHRGEFRCFWTWPWGHVWVGNAYGETCKFCTAKKSNTNGA